MEFKGTKGKWYPEKDNEYPSLHNIWSDTKDKHLSQCTLIARTSYAPLSEANALLISKAPALLNDIIKDLKLLEMVAKEIEHSDKWLHSDVLQRIEEKKQLIKQATEL